MELRRWKGREWSGVGVLLAERTVLVKALSYEELWHIHRTERDQSAWSVEHRGHER